MTMIDDDTPAEGWTDITKLFRSRGINKCAATLRHYHRDLGMPVLRNPAGWPVMSVAMYRQWLVTINEVMDEE